jgi:polar amino acid transport system substrate-binding protein
MSGMLRWIVIVAAFLSAATSARAEDLHRILDAGTVRIGVCVDSEPSGYRDSDGNFHGYDIDVATLVAEALGVELALVRVTVVSRMPELLAGRIDIVACNITATTERAKTIDFSFPYLRTGIKLLVQRDAGISGLDDVDAAARVVVGRGTTGEMFVGARFPEAQVLFAENPGDAELLLRLRQADVYIDDSLIVDYIAKDHPDQLVALPETYSVDAIAFGIRKGNPELLRWLDLFASTYVSSGKYAEVYGKWWGGPPPPLTPIW